MKKLCIGALASLMLAGAISAVSGETRNTTTGMIAVAFEGSAPITLSAVPDIAPSDGTSLAK